MNDPTFLEAAKVLGEQMSKLNDVREGILFIYRKLCGRYPSERELQLLETLQQKEMEKFRTHPEKADGLLNTGMYKIPSQSNKIKIAANSIVASTLLNSDAVITKR